MKLIFRPPILSLLLCFTAPTLGIEISSVPAADSGGFIQTELEQTVSLLCRSDSSSTSSSGIQAEEELVWRRNGAVVRLKEENRKGNSSVCITPVTHEDNDATFICQHRRNASIKASVTLNVTYPPDLSGSEEVSVEVDEALVLRCNTFANPPVSSVTWMLNGSTLDLVAAGLLATSDGSTSKLTTDNAELGLHEGRYQCTAVSPVYGARSKVFQVTVTEKIMKFPKMPMIAGIVVVALTMVLAFLSRWEKIVKCCK